MAKHKQINVTKNYGQFIRSEENRPVDLKRHRKLVESMKEYGFIPEFPIVCVRDKDDRLIVKDGQHRLAIAFQLGIPVFWVESDIQFDTAKINCTSKTWVAKDYANTFAMSGKVDYQEGIDFAAQHGIPVTIAFSLLGGTVSWGNVSGAFFAGEFKVTDKRWAGSVAGIYKVLSGLSSKVRNSRFIAACMAVCRVEGFDPKRLLSNAERCPDKLLSYSTRDAYLEMIEDIYNFGRAKLVPLKIEALTAMRERSAVPSGE